MTMLSNELDLLITGVIAVGGLLGLTMGAIRLAMPFAMTVAMIFILERYPQWSSAFSPEAPSRFFLYLLLAFVALVVFGLITRIVKAAAEAGGLKPLDRILGGLLGLMLATILAGAGLSVVLQSGLLDESLQRLLHTSRFAPPVMEFYLQIMAFVHRLFEGGQPEAEPEPWWKRPLMTT